MHASHHNIYHQHDIYCVFFAVTDCMTTKLKIYPQQHPPESTILHQFSAKTINNSRGLSLRNFLGTGLAVPSERSKLLVLAS